MTALQLLALIWAVFLLLTGPLNAIVARRARVEPAPKRREGYAGVSRGLGILGALTLSIDFLNDKTGIKAFFAFPPLPVLFAWTILTTLICLGISIGFLFLRRIFKRPLPPSIVSMLPRTRRDLFGWTGISLVAGVLEEYVYRGFCLILVASTTSSPLLAFLLVTLAFGIGHGYQDLLWCSSGLDGWNRLSNPRPGSGSSGALNSSSRDNRSVRRIVRIL